MKSLCFLSCGGEATQGAISSIACPAAAFFRTEMCPLQNGQTDRRTDLLRILIYFISFYICFIFVSWTCGHGYFGVFGIRLGITLSTLLVRAFATQCQFSFRIPGVQGSLSVPFSGRWQTRWLARRAGKCGAEQQERRAQKNVLENLRFLMNFGIFLWISELFLWLFLVLQLQHCEATGPWRPILSQVACWLVLWTYFVNICGIVGHSWTNWTNTCDTFSIFQPCSILSPCSGLSDLVT